jgi:hypothetical protein
LQIESKGDIKLVGRAIRSGWNVDKEAVKDALMQVVESRDPELMIDAIKLLVLADSIDVKREELAAKQAAKDNDQRLRLLELARSVPVADLTRIASENGIATNGVTK